MDLAKFSEYPEIFHRLAQLHWGREFTAEELQSIPNPPVSFAMVASILDQFQWVSLTDWAQRLGIFLPDSTYEAQEVVVLYNMADSIDFLLRDNKPEFSLWSTEWSKFSMAELIEASKVLPHGWNRQDLYKRIRILRRGSHRFILRDTPEGMICVGNLSRHQVVPEESESFDVTLDKLFRFLMLGIGDKNQFNKTPAEIKDGKE